MAKKHFLYGETHTLFQQLEELCQQSGVSRGQAFEDLLTASVCALAGGSMEEEYLSVAKRYSEGTPGCRGIDRMAAMFGCLIEAMEETRHDILGDFFQGAITYGEAGQFLTPETVCDLMARMAGPGGRFVRDPCCGTGRMLLAAAEVDRRREFIGQDIDLRCVRITAINLALRNLYGYVLWGDTLRGECKRVYRTGFHGRGFIRDAAPDELPPVPEPTGGPLAVTIQGKQREQPGPASSMPGRQLHLF